MMAIDKQNNRHTISPQTHIVFIMTRPKGIVICHKIETGNNQGRQQTNPRDNRCFNCNYCRSKINKLSSPVIYLPPPLNNSVINPPQLSPVCQQSSGSSPNSPRDNKFFDSNHINSKRNELSSPVIPKLTLWNDPFINPTQLSSVRQQSSSSLPNTTHKLQASSIPGRTSPDPSNTIPPSSTNDGSCNIYGCMVDVSKLTLAKRTRQLRWINY